MVDKEIIFTFLPDGNSFRELLRPWKLATFSIGMLWLIYGALFYDICDWDVGISIIMGGLTYIFAPWSVITIYNSLKFRQPMWPLRIIVALIPAMFAVDWVYWIYHSILGNSMLRWENFKASMVFYFICGILWSYRGSVKDFLTELGIRKAAQKPVIKPQPTFLQKLRKFVNISILALIISACAIAAFGHLKIKWAKKQVEAFSNMVVIGMPVEGLEERAKKLHLNYKRVTDSNDKDGEFCVWEGFVFDRWFCNVEYKDGKAISKKVNFLD